MTRREALLGGPGLRAYAYNAALYCIECGRAIIIKLFEGSSRTAIMADEDVPSPCFFPESDQMEHCNECEDYLYGEVADEE